MLKIIRDFFGYWYFRYLLVTELYMVEKWERAMFHIVLGVVLSVLYAFNAFVVIGVIKMLRNSEWQSDTLSVF